MCNPPHARCYLGECDVYQLFTLGIVVTKIMQRNGVVWSDAFNSLSYQSPIAQWKSDTTQPQVHSGKSHSSKEWHSNGINCWVCHLSVWRELMVSLCAWGCSDTKKVKLTFLHPQGPSNSFKNPEPCNIIHNIPMDDILTLVDQKTRSGRVYSLIKKRNDFWYRKASVCHHSKNLYFFCPFELVWFILL